MSTTMTSEEISKNDANMFYVTQVMTIELPPSRMEEAKYETIDDCDYSDSAMLELDERLIDYDMLMADNEEADRIYHELKERALKQRRKDIKDKEIEEAIELEDLESEESDSSSSEVFAGQEKILSLLERYNRQEKEDFANSLPNFANKRDKR